MPCSATLLAFHRQWHTQPQVSSARPAKAAPAEALTRRMSAGSTGSSTSSSSSDGAASDTVEVAPGRKGCGGCRNAAEGRCQRPLADALMGARLSQRN